MSRKITEIFKTIERDMAVIVASILAAAENRQLARQQQRERWAKARLLHEMMIDRARKRRPF